MAYVVTKLAISDPLRDAGVCRESDCHFHVDAAAQGGATLMSNVTVIYLMVLS